MLTCRDCLLSLPKDAFYASNGSRCKECIKAAVRANRLAKIDHYRQFDRLRSNLPHRVEARRQYQQTPQGRLAMARANKRWQVSNAIRRAAHIAVGNAVRDGRLEPQPCFVCGAKADAHHADYDAPLAVTWLCKLHHAQTHKEHRQWLHEAA